MQKSLAARLTEGHLMDSGGHLSRCQRLGKFLKKLCVKCFFLLQFTVFVHKNKKGTEKTLM